MPNSVKIRYNKSMGNGMRQSINNAVDTGLLRSQNQNAWLTVLAAIIEQYQSKPDDFMIVVQAEEDQDKLFKAHLRIPLGRLREIASS